jgi:FAD:protein FMN transferase
MKARAALRAWAVDTARAAAPHSLLLPTLLAACTLAAACGTTDRGVVEERLFSMGTWVDLTLVGASEQQAAAALDDVAEMLEPYARDYYAWADGELARVNAALAAGRPIVASAELTDLLRTAKRLSLASGGAFDPGVGGLVELWGFQTAPPPDAAPPTPASIDAWLASGSTIAALEIDGREVSATTTTLALDLGGIAKGRAVDAIVEILGRHGVTDAVVNAGGDLRVLGSRGDRRWRIGVQDPRGGGVLGTVELGDGEAAFTSGDYERYYETGATRAHHLLDPATGRPATHTQAVTVITADGTTADAAATALFVAGPDRWRQVADALGIKAVLRVDADGSFELTGPMRDRLQITAETGSDIIAPTR